MTANRMPRTSRDERTGPFKGWLGALCHFSDGMVALSKAKRHSELVILL